MRATGLHAKLLISMRRSEWSTAFSADRVLAATFYREAGFTPAFARAPHRFLTA